jgi:molybdopterin-guanine dinucleotide biosynthesis protein A
LVLAGGRSSRFGADKALARFHEQTLLELSLDRFSPCQARAVAMRSDGPAAAHASELGASVVYDRPHAAEGPLAGIAAGLAWAHANGCTLLAIAPCDAPLLRWRHYECLLQEIGDAAAAFAVTSTGKHPLCSVWSCDLLSVIEEAMTGGDHPSVRGFLRAQGARSVRFEDARGFANANTAAELAHFAAEPVH